jgi:NTP pyrophosphatase (non-canonical NTP hydrolase)
MNSFDLRTFQAEVAEWAERNFGETAAWQTALGVSEEAGEVARVVLKNSQGIRGFETPEALRAHLAKEAADVVIYLAHLLDIVGVDLQWAIATTWERVRQRDWVADNERGGQ